MGLFILAIISASWIRHNTLDNRLNLMSLLADSMADRIVAVNEQAQNPADLIYEEEIKTELEIDPFTYIVDTNGTIILNYQSQGPIHQKLNPSILMTDKRIQKLTFSKSEFYLVKSPLLINHSIIGWVVMIDTKDNLTYVNQEYTQLAIMIIGLALFGWAAIYVLSNRLAKPIKNVAAAAKQVAEGNYQIILPEASKEKEVHELIDSFKEMTIKLEKLESLRTELLAGVTHELKTPVSSISGLLQALKEGVVSGEEAKEFLILSLNETEKMQTMVEDLLAFNQFATNTVPINKKPQHINEVIEEAVTSWKITNQLEEMNIKVSRLSNPAEINIDPIRFQQIMTNLLNNARQAMDNKGDIFINVMENNSQITIEISDTGSGIPEAEQPFIFERFYRGEKKKYKIRGLGLGLALSKMIAQAHGGDLVLVKSDNEGTTFRITFPK